MTKLTFSPSGPQAGSPASHIAAGYAAGRQRSPATLTAAIALNGSVFALILALPATHYIIDSGPDLVTHWVPINADPPKNRPEPVKREKPLQKPIPVPDDTRVVTPDQVVTLTGTGPATGGGTIDLGDFAGTGDLTPPADPPHKAVFRGATRDPRYAGAFRPEYPPAMRRQGLEGSVTVRVTIDENGRVTAV